MKKRAIIEYIVVLSIMALLSILVAFTLAKNVFPATNTAKTSTQPLSSVTKISDKLIEEHLSDYDVCKSEPYNVIAAILDKKKASLVYSACLKCQDPKQCLANLNNYKFACINYFRALPNYAKLGCYYMFDCSPIQAFCDSLDEDKSFAYFVKTSFLSGLFNLNCNTVRKSKCYTLFYHKIPVEPGAINIINLNKYKELFVYWGKYYPNSAFTVDDVFSWSIVYFDESFPTLREIANNLQRNNVFMWVIPLKKTIKLTISETKDPSLPLVLDKVVEQSLINELKAELYYYQTTDYENTFVIGVKLPFVFSSEEEFSLSKAYVCSNYRDFSKVWVSVDSNSIYLCFEPSDITDLFRSEIIFAKRKLKRYHCEQLVAYSKTPCYKSERVWEKSVNFPMHMELFIVSI